MALLPSSAQDQFVRHYVLEGTWQPIIRCPGCNPHGWWSGPGATNAHGQSIIAHNLQEGDQIRIRDLQGTIYNGQMAVSCRDNHTRLQHTALAQFLDHHNHVVPLPNGGYRWTNAMRLIDMEHGITVPPGASQLWVSWPDTSYSDNSGSCSFAFEHTPVSRFPSMYNPPSHVALQPPIVKKVVPKQKPKTRSLRAVRKQQRLARRQHNSFRAPIAPPAAVQRRSSPQHIFFEPPVQDIVKARPSGQRQHSPQVYDRMVRRLARRTGQSPLMIHQQLEQNVSPQELNDFYEKGPETMKRDTYGYGAVEIRESAPPAFVEPPLLHQPYPPVGPPATAKPESPKFTPPSDVATKPFASDTYSADHIVNTLCRAQERITQSTPYPELVINELAPLFAQRWEIDEAFVADILANPDKCTTSAQTQLQADLLGKPPASTTTTPTATMTSDTQENVVDSSTGLEMSVSRLLLIVLSMMALSFILFIVLIILPLVQMRQRDGQESADDSTP